MDKKTKKIIEQQINYKFANEKLLEQAFTRRSYSQENGGQDNEILEFFGDKVLDFCVTRKLSYFFGEIVQTGYYSTFGETEKDLTNIRKHLVESSMLAHRIDVLGLANFLKMGKGDENKSIQNEQHVKEDLFESILGAVAVDCNWNTVVLNDVVNFMLDLDSYLNNRFENIDYVVEVQKWFQINYKNPPKYEYFYRELDKWNSIINCDNRKRIEAGSGKIGCRLEVSNIIFIGYSDNKSKARKETVKILYDYLNENGLLHTVEDEIGEPCIDKAINQLQELSQKGYCERPEYKFKETHDSNGNPRWVCECCVENQEYTYSSESSSKKTAKKRAAYFMLLYVLGYDPTEDEEWGGDDE